jgi:hypothetical protein
MIQYRLKCSAEHGFEAWFRSSEDFDRQAERGLVACPACGVTSVEKALMAPSLSRGVQIAAETAPASVPEARPFVAPSERMRELVTAMRELRRQVIEGSEDTGRRFPEEARKIHHGEAEARGIYGQATPEEARALIEEGIGVAPLPVLPEDFN